MQPNWKKMFLLSFLIHLGVFSLIFFVPETAPTRSLKGVIYEVNLVELPKKAGAGVGRPKAKTVSRSKKGVAIRTKKHRVRRIGRIRTKERPVIIAKKTVRRKRKSKKPRLSPDKVLEQALAKVEKKVEKREKGRQEEKRVEEAISRIEKGVKKSGAEPGSGTGGGPVTGLRIQIYKTEVESSIKGNWAYPAGLTSPSKREELEAIVILTVLRDGTISQFTFKKRSGDAIFDESVAKAIERSNPLPPFPEGFLKSSEEIEINFNLRELEEA